MPTSRLWSVGVLRRDWRRARTSSADDTVSDRAWVTVPRSAPVLGHTSIRASGDCSCLSCLSCLVCLVLSVLSVSRWWPTLSSFLSPPGERKSPTKSYTHSSGRRAPCRLVRWVEPPDGTRRTLFGVHLEGTWRISGETFPRRPVHRRRQSRQDFLLGQPASPSSPACPRMPYLGGYASYSTACGVHAPGTGRSMEARDPAMNAPHFLRRRLSTAGCRCRALDELLAHEETFDLCHALPTSSLHRPQLDDAPSRPARPYHRYGHPWTLTPARLPYFRSKPWFADRRST